MKTHLMRLGGMVCLALASSLLHATTFTWTVGSRYDANSYNDNNLWSNPLNWSPNGVPGIGDIALVGAAPYGNPDPVGGLLLPACKSAVARR